MSRPDPSPSAAPAGALRAPSCEACGQLVSIDAATGRTRAADGSTGTVTFADEALLVWDCPSCGRAQAEDLTE